MVAATATLWCNIHALAFLFSYTEQNTIMYVCDVCLNYIFVILRRSGNNKNRIIVYEHLKMQLHS